MESEWASVSLDLRPYRLSSELATVSVASADAVQALVDEHYARTSTMSASRYASSFSRRITAWLATLTAVQTALDAWLAAQVQWAYLEPIFASASMCEALPDEARQFQAIDARWRKLQRTAIADPRAMSMLRQQGIVATLTGAQAGMDAVMRGLRAFLESESGAHAGQRRTFSHHHRCLLLPSPQASAPSCRASTSYPTTSCSRCSQRATTRRASRRTSPSASRALRS